MYVPANHDPTHKSPSPILHKHTYISPLSSRNIYIFHPYPPEKLCLSCRSTKLYMFLSIMTQLINVPPLSSTNIYTFHPYPPETYIHFTPILNKNCLSCCSTKLHMFLPIMTQLINVPPHPPQTYIYFTHILQKKYVSSVAPQN